MWVISSSSNTLDLPLKKLAKQRIKKRGEVEFETFDNYIEIRQSCWIIEESEGQYYCDCPLGMKGRLCKHTIGMQYKEGRREVTSQVRAVPVGQKRKRGRPKNLGNCLLKSPAQSVLPPALATTAVPPSSPTRSSICLLHLLGPHVPPRLL